MAVLVPLGGAVAQEAPAAIHDPDLAERAEVAASAYHIIKRYFAHAEGLPADYDFEGRYREYLREALAAPDRRAFSLATLRLFASLRNGHTGFVDERMMEAAPLPFTVGRLEGRWTILTSRLPALSPGDRIAAVDGGPVDEWLAPVRAATGQSGAAALDRASWRRAYLLPERFRLTLDDGRSVEVDRTAPNAAPAAGRLDTVVTRRPDGAVVIRVPGFDEPVFERDAVAAVRAAAANGARAVLFDLRGNGGGSTPVELLRAVMKRPYRGTIVLTPLTVAEDDAHASYEGTLAALPTTMKRYGPDRTEPDQDAVTLPMGVLVDGGCGSACEDFVIRFKDGARGPVMGEPTYGSTGQPYFVNFPALGMRFQVSTKREFLPDGSPFEGSGMTPNIAIPLTVADLKTSADLQLEQAVQTLLAR